MTRFEGIETYFGTRNRRPSAKIETMTRFEGIETEFFWAEFYRFFIETMTRFEGIET